MFSGNFITITKVKNMVLNILVFKCLNGRTGDFESNYKKVWQKCCHFNFILNVTFNSNFVSIILVWL